MKEKTFLQRILTVLLSVAVFICSVPAVAYAAELDMVADAVSADSISEDVVSADAITPDVASTEPTADEALLDEVGEEPITPDQAKTTYTVKFFDDGKELKNLEFTYQVGDTEIRLPDVPEKKGYWTNGWREQNDPDGIAYASSSLVLSDIGIWSAEDYRNLVFIADRTAYTRSITLSNLSGIDAQSIATLVEIGFEMDDDNNPYSAIFYPGIEDELEIPAINKPGARFIKWDDGNPNTTDGPTVTIWLQGFTGHADFVAVFEEGEVATDHTVTLTGLDGIDDTSKNALTAVGFSLNETTATIKRTNQESLYIPAISKKHNNFDGWKRNPGSNKLSSTVSLAAGEITSDLSYSANFTSLKTITVNFKLNGGSFRPADTIGWDAFGYSSERTSFSAYADDDLSAIVKIPVPSKKDNVFTGWTVNGGAKVINYVLPIPDDQTITLAATWTSGTSGETVIETGGNASGTIDGNSLNTIKTILDNNVSADETSVTKLVVDEQPGNAYMGTVIDDELNGALSGITVPVNKTYVNITINQYINSDSASTSREITDLGQVVDIIYRPSDGAANLRAVIREHEGSYTRFRMLDSMPDVLEDATYFIDGPVVHIFTRFFSVYGFGYEKELVLARNGAVVARNADGKNTVTLIDGSNYTRKASINTVKGVDKKTYKITRIESGALKDNLNITKLSIGSNVRVIGDSAFEGCSNLRSASFGSKVTSIGSRAFYGTGIAKANVSGKTTSIGSYAFANCPNLKSASITGKVSLIGASAFENCPILATVKIGKTVKTVDAKAFYGCNGLKTLTIGSGVTTIGASAFEGCPIATLNISMANIPDGLFQGYACLTKLGIGSGVRTIGASAFEGCVNLKKATYGSKVTTIGDLAFYGTGVTKVSIGKNTRTIGARAFQNCLNLKTATIGSKVNSIGDYAFADCTNLRKITVGKSVGVIGDYAFAGCTSMASTTIGASVSYIGAGAYQGNTNLGSVTVNSKKLTELPSTGDNFLSGIKPTATIKVPKKVFNQTKTVFETKSGAGNQIRYKKF